ncbi:MIND complex subunit MTW1 [Aspergillus glaucus CBS 516.65]|uniref:MIND kinetochore complex component Mtw1 n=1 Tax=Aspergillus glaucus CBS 516.65 TaxID=1160497 RepID=A0A1L9VVC6_ASPGL|nr:hypothetical protein ASPGLDRAFT_999490 [Aspergillus glaucus CBS 516.65]OJJ87837.1 hypothetical protein ASPGLDRAFT_999490 [Aspergillus glaucus CBS 516.65]
MNDATTSLLTEHFSYTPLSLIDDVINSINNLIYQAISSLESGLLGTPPERLGFSHANNGSTIPDTDEDGNVIYPEAKLEIENGLHQLETLLESTVDKAYDKFEIYVLRNILTVPEDLISWVRLRHYEGLSFNPGPDTPTPEMVLEHRKKLHETRKLNRSLKQERARNDAVISQLRSILSTVSAAKNNGDSTATAGKDLDLSFLTSSSAAQQLRVGAVTGPNTHHTPLTTNTTFILSQLPALQAMLKQLRPKLDTLPKSAELAEKDPKKDERKEYIESRIRLHLERAGQLAVGSDGDPIVAGRRIGNSEAHALEAVTSILTQGDNKPE